MKKLRQLLALVALTLVASCGCVMPVWAQTPKDVERLDRGGKPQDCAEATVAEAPGDDTSMLGENGKDAWYAMSPDIEFAKRTAIKPLRLG